MLTGRRYRLALTPDQAVRCEEFGGICRAVWNTALDQRRQYRQRGAWMNYVPHAAELADAKKEPELAWLKTAPSHILQQALKDLERAGKDHGTWKVQFRVKHRWNRSFRFPAGNLIEIERRNKWCARVKLPKLGWVRFRWTRALGGQIRSATVTQDGAEWFVSFRTEDGIGTPERHAAPDSGVGVDRGVAVAVATSDGKLLDRTHRAEGETKRRKRLQQKLARQKKGSADRRKTLLQLRKLDRRTTNRRGDFCNQTASQLARKNALVAVEDLRITNMTRSAQGTIDEPGTNVAQKSGLNRSILDKGWHRLELALRSTARYTGTQVVKIPAAYTSQTCSQCRTLDPKYRESQAVFRCATCGHCENADVNAAKNILTAGRAATACGDLRMTRPVKQEPQPALALVGIPRP